MAMNFKTYEVSIDLINNTSTTSTIRFSQNDQNSAKLLLNITNKTVEIDLSTATVRMSFKKPDGTRVFQDDCQPINALKGKYQIILKTQTLAAVGKVIGQVHIEENGRIIDTQKIVFEVDESLSSDDAIESTNEYGKIQLAIDAAEKFEGKDLDGIIAAGDKADTAIEKSNENANQIGILSELETTNKTNLVKAINEAKNSGLTEQQKQDLAAAKTDASTAKTDAASAKTEATTARTEKIPATRFDTSSDANKIKQINLSDEVKQMMAGTTPVNATPADGSVTKEKLAPGSVDNDKLAPSVVDYKKQKGKVAQIIGKRVLTYDTVAKTLTIPSSIMIVYDDTFFNIPAQSVDFSGLAAGLKFIYYNFDTNKVTVERYSDSIRQNVSNKVFLFFENGNKIFGNNQSVILNPEEKLTYIDIANQEATISEPGAIIIDYTTLTVKIVKPFYVLYDDTYKQVNTQADITGIDFKSGIHYFFYNVGTGLVEAERYTGTSRQSKNKVYLFFTVNQTIGGKNKDKIRIISETTMHPTTQLIGKTWNAIGDSITQPNDTYHYIIKNSLGINVNNFGISGSRAAINGTTNDKDSLCNRMTPFNNNADLMTIFIGTNDWSGNVPLGSIDSTNNNEFYGALNNVITSIITNNLKTRLALFTPLRRVDCLTAKNTANLLLKDYVDAVKNIAAKYSLPVLDLYGQSGINELTYATFLADGLHPNIAGKVHLANIVRSFLNTI